ncbi:Os04g0433000 [Oryza sativa Japonica Group]|uniref:Os04g0433000 protein n=3 Tax=Oryza sativa TaxID=4530 RepID=Q7XUZ3_ORYSJ|nr:Bric-a-Brac, Tramtrack, Broad Complex BTB domain protein MrBTB1 [Oryza sativa Japonica Group]BAG98906.1 unnamed protein product [Oryza sativa Japonica Group]BAS89281.1 Os04g0433000 [Oryza sativa Japonica Group]CAD40916.2 OSJNBa0088K19.4 [Oryza sativa Japonica Group]CAH67129.1 H0315E07.7 [Oryza sativa]
MPTSTGSRKPVRSASTIIAGTESGQHLLKIDGYSHTKDKLPTPGSNVKSRSFRVGGHSWHISYYPSGNDSDKANCISIFLNLDDDVDVKAQFKFSLLDRAGRQPARLQKQRVGVCEFHPEGRAGEIGVSPGRLPHDRVRPHRLHGAADGGHRRRHRNAAAAAAAYGGGPTVGPAPAPRRPPRHRGGRRRDVRGQREDVRGTQAGARGPVSGVPCRAFWAKQGAGCHDRRRGGSHRHTHRRHGGAGLRGSAPLHVHRLAAGARDDERRRGRGGDAPGPGRGGEQVQDGEAEAGVRAQTVRVRERENGCFHACIRPGAPLRWPQGEVLAFPRRSSESERDREGSII